jgi:hypothetical protein
MNIRDYKRASGIVGIHRKCSFVILGFSLLVLAVAVAARPAQASVALEPLLSQGGTITLNPGTTYTLAQQYTVTKDTTIIGNRSSGTTIVASAGKYAGPLVASGVTLQLEDCVIAGAGWGAIGADGGGHLVVKNSDIRCPSNTGVYLKNSSATIENSTISNCQYAVNALGASHCELHGVAVSDSVYAALIHGGTLLVDQGSSFVGANEGVGLASIDGAVLTVRDSTFRGYINAIDVQPTPDAPHGTVDVEGCRFYRNYSSALCTVDAVNVRFVGCYVENAVTDGIYLQSSTGLIDGCEIHGSLNTGVTFWGCSGGATLQNTLVEGSVHQGIAVVEGSKKVLVLNNTAFDNTIANLLVDAKSNAIVQGNLFYGTPDLNVRLQGTRGTKLESNLIAYSQKGMEVKGGSNPKVTFCAVTSNKRGGILVYDRSPITLINDFLRDNDLKHRGAYSLFINQGAQGSLRGCRIGPRGSLGVYNNAGTLSDMESNYWDSSRGPALSGEQRSGTGAVLGWNAHNGSRVRYRPFKNKAPLVGSITHSLSLGSGASLSWPSTAGVTLTLTGMPAVNGITQQVAGALRCADTGYLTSWRLPTNLIPGRLYTVWVAHPLRTNSSEGSLQFEVAGETSIPQLLRRSPLGGWKAEPATWDPITQILTYSPDDLNSLNGTFALVH